MTKPHSDFGTNRSRYDGLQTHCKSCRAASYKENALTHRLRSRGVTLEEYERMSERAEGHCEICDAELDAFDGLNGLVIDHTDDRPFGKRGRGLLCNSCNLGIGLLKHSPERLMAAAEYVSKF